MKTYTFSLPSLNEISKKYNELVPDRFLGLVIIELYLKTESKELEGIFSIIDVERSVMRVNRYLSLHESSQLEHWLQKLIPTYLDQPPNKFDQYTLTEYSRRFAQLLIEKLENPYKGLPLASTFQKYFTLDQGQIQSFSELREWYVFGFEETVRKAIHQHLEALRDSVKEQLDDLQALLDLEELEAQKKIRQFTIVFAQLADEAKDLSESLELSIGTIRSLSKITELFEERVNESESEEISASIKEFEDVRNIQQVVRSFFEKIDLRMEMVQAQISHASSKLSELQENFKERALFKIQIKKFYLNLLRNSSLDKLPEGLRKPNVVFTGTRHYNLAYHDFEVVMRQPGVTRPEESEHSSSARKKVELSMYVQERTNHWVTNLSRILDSGEPIVFEKNFFEILTKEGNVEVAIQVGHGLIQRAQYKPDWKLDITKELQSDNLHKDISLWKILITPA